ncbi:MAG: lysylphosphatidylglycerol synthase transmembrane domain-containing protein [Micromonosporaceae bacterium]
MATFEVTEAQPTPAESVPANTAGLHCGWKSLLKGAVALLLIGGVGYAGVRQWAGVRPLLGELSWQALGVAAVAVFAGIFSTFLAWRTIVADLGFPLPVGAAMRIFFVSQLGKYVPGKLWPILVQIRLGRAYQIPARASGAASLVFLLMVIGSGLVVAVPTLPLIGGRAWGAYWWTALILVVAVLVALPPVLNRLIAWGLRLTRREPLPRALSAKGIAAAGFWSVLAWFGYGIHVWALARDLGADNSLWLYAVATGGFAAAFSAGFLFPVAPAGAGAREAAMILLLGVALAGPKVIVIAVISRLLFTVLDAVWAGIGALAARTGRDQGLTR